MAHLIRLNTNRRFDEAGGVVEDEKTRLLGPVQRRCIRSGKDRAELAVRRFHAAGFWTLGGHIDLTMDLAARRHEWLPGASLHGLDFDY